MLFRKASPQDKEVIWELLQQGIQRRKEAGSLQWQNGYPNTTVIEDDIVNGYAHVLILDDSIIGYCAILENDEPAYNDIDGAWLSEGDFVVVHRLVVSDTVLGKGIGQLLLTEVEKYALRQNILSVKIDTNFDNLPMLAILEKMKYSYCGEVLMMNSPRKAFEKILKDNQ